MGPFGWWLSLYCVLAITTALGSVPADGLVKSVCACMSLSLQLRLVLMVCVPQYGLSSPNPDKASQVHLFGAYSSLPVSKLFWICNVFQCVLLPISLSSATTLHVSAIKRASSRVEVSPPGTA
jgi:hypothetical protein